MKRILITFSLLIFTSIIHGCSASSDKLTIGMIPVRDAKDLEKEFEPVKLYLEKTLNVDIDIQVTDSYASLVKKMKNGTIDIGWYGAFSFIAAESELNLTPLVVQQRKETGLYYQSLIITKNDSRIENIEDLKDSVFAFVDAGSTSGFVLPFALFKSRNINMEQHFKDTVFSGTHEQVLIDIGNGRVDAGAISSIQYNELIKLGKINKETYKIIWQSENIPSSPIVARSDIDNGIKQGFIEAMLNIHIQIPNELKMFDDSIVKFIEIDNKIYHPIRNIATILGKDYMYEYFLKGECCL
nr:phosphate/phosphite/phosphonate ABC transporter substrate-binding protein [Lysinibacillus timonensis]